MCKARDVPGFVVFATFPRRRCAWPGYWLLVRPVGFPAALRLAGLLAGGAACGIPGGAALGRATGGGAACGMGSPGEAFMPTPGRFTVVRCEKSPYFRTSSYLEYGGEGGLTRFARPCGAVRLLRSRSVQLAAPVVEPRSGVLIPPNGEYKRKKPVLSYELSSRIWR